MGERKKGIDTARVSQRCLAGFFVAMFFCTIASRIYDSVTVPKVACQRMRQKAVETVAAADVLSAARLMAEFAWEVEQ